VKRGQGGSDPASREAWKMLSTREMLTQRPVVLNAERESGMPNNELIDLPNIRQEDGISCGPAIAMSVGKFFGVGPDDLEEWKKNLGTTENQSTAPGAIFAYLRSLGLQVYARSRMTINDLRECWQQGHPVICPIQADVDQVASLDAGHYVAVVGIGLGQVIVQDPSADNMLDKPGGSVPKDEESADGYQTPGRSMIAFDRWNKVWNDKDVNGNEYLRFGIVVSGGKEQD
jgi:hypothetical protein